MVDPMLQENKENKKYFHQKNQEFNYQKTLKFEKTFKNSIQANRKILSQDFNKYKETQEF